MQAVGSLVVSLFHRRRQPRPACSFCRLSGTFYLCMAHFGQNDASSFCVHLAMWAVTDVCAEWKQYICIKYVREVKHEGFWQL